MTIKDINAHVGKQLRLRRTSLGLSQEALGKGVGVTSQQVQKYEKGTNSMTAARLYQFAGFLKVQPAYFFDGFSKLQQNPVGMAGVAEETNPFEGEDTASDRETIEAMKSFRSLKSRATRKRMADLLRTLVLQGI